VGVPEAKVRATTAVESSEGLVSDDLAGRESDEGLKDRAKVCWSSTSVLTGRSHPGS